MTRHVPLASTWPARRDAATGTGRRRRHRAHGAARSRCLTRSCTCTWRPATPCSTAPPTRTSWSSGPSSRRWTPSPSPTATAPTARSGSPRPACRAGSGRCSGWTSPSRRCTPGPGAPAGPARPAGRRPPGAGRPPAAERSATGGCPGSTFLAGSKRGWAALCRLVSATHLAGERGDPVSTLDLVAEHVAGARRAWCCSAPAPSWAGRPTLRRDDLAQAALAPWLEVVDRADLLVELVSHRLPGSGPGVLAARRPDGRRRPVGRSGRWCSPTRSATPTGSTPRPSTCSTRPAGWCRSASTSAPRPVRQRRGLPQVRQADGRGGRGGLPVRRARLRQRPGGPAAARPHPHRRRPLRPRPAPRPRPGGGALPGVPGGHRRGRRAAPTADGVLRARCESAVGRRYGGAPRQRIWKRLDDELQTIGALGYAPYFLTVADVTDLIKDMGRALRGARVRARAAWSTTCSASPASTRCGTTC